LNASAGGVRSGQAQEIGREIYAGHAVSAPRELDRMTGAAAWDVKQARSGRHG